MILGRRLPPAVTSGPRSSKPSGASEIRPARAAGRTTRWRATVPSASSTGRAANCCPSRSHAIRTGSLRPPTW